MNLYLAHVGFYDNTLGMYELHSNFLVVASNPKEAKEKIKNKEIFISKNMHIDGLLEISHVDGYKINLEDMQNNSENNILSYDDVKKLS